MRHLDLFSGIGGFALAASWVWGEEHEIHSFVEIEPFCQKVLNKHWPDVPIHEDIKTYEHDGTPIDLISGGYPCQPFSTLGSQRAEEDPRHLWPQMLRIVKQARPTWVVAENVAGHIVLGLDKVLHDLEGEGYTSRTFVIPAMSVGMPHKRERVFIVANTNPINDRGVNKKSRGSREKIFQTDRKKTWAFWKSTIKKRLNPRWENRWEVKPGMDRTYHGVPVKLHKDRLVSLGNAIVPQVVVPIMESIKQIDAVTA